MFFPLRDENPTDKKPVLTISLIVLNVVIFLFTYFSGAQYYNQFIMNYGMIPQQVANYQGLHTIFTSMFLHGGFLHVISNVWFLWIFGDNIEDLFGRGKFLLIYFGAGLCANIAHVLFNPTSLVPTIGASGAVAGVLGAYIVKYPRAKVVTLLFFFLFINIIKVPSVTFLGIWILLQIISATYTTAAQVQVSVAYWAHIGGFAAGMLLAWLFGEQASGTYESISQKYEKVSRFLSDKFKRADSLINLER